MSGKTKPLDLTTCTVQSPLHHDGVSYAIGERVALPPEIAEALIAQGVVLPLGAKLLREGNDA